MPKSHVELVFDFPGLNRRTYTRPVEVLCANHLSDVRAVLDAAQDAAARGAWAAGFVSYEAAPAFDRAMHVADDRRMPLAWFAVFDQPHALDRPATTFRPPAFKLAHSRAAYCDRVARIREEIACGRTYQVNLTTRYTSAFRGDAFAWYESLRRAQGSGYHAYVDTGDFVIVSASPELFFEIRGVRIHTRPMKGTRRRGRWREEDEMLATELAASEKDRAENLMIVDLLRNDLGRVATVGSVDVTSLFDVERYRTVHQLTSTIAAELRTDVTLTDVFAALFPCGSVTGAPKISTMQLITELEDAPREVYCGAIGVIEPGGAATFSVPIRTVWIERATGGAVYGSGAGITFDSDPDQEFAEVEAKAAVLVEAWPDFELLETMCAEQQRIIRLDRHVARVLASAHYFDIAVAEPAIRAALERAAAEVTDPQIVRLLVNQRGALRTELKNFERVSEPPVGLARTPISSSDRFLFHKTTHRRTYEQLIGQRPECWDLLLWNERGELTEFTRGNLVLEMGGRLVTPARECGLLAGTFRAELLEAGRIREETVRVSELEHASRAWFVNSVREWLEVDLSQLRADVARFRAPLRREREALNA